ncbi:unnamed protein product [Penicillium discolor]
MSTTEAPRTDEAPRSRPTTLPARQAALMSSSRVEQKGNIVVTWITSTDHKTIGYMYLIASVMFFLLGGVMALVIRAELFAPGMQIVPTKEQYNQLFTMHGTIMLLMFATPLFAGFANAIMPLQIGAPDVAFPRLNAFSFWLFLFGSTIAVAGFLTPQGAASFGWFAYQPLANASFSPGAGGNLWMLGLGISGFGTILGAVNFITTIITMRAPGMTMWRMPIFSWNTLITSLLILMAFPVLAAALFAAAADRVLGAHIYDPANGGVLLWQHLFWFFGHPEVYIIALPFFGIVSEIFPVFSRKPIFGYKTLVYATIAIAALSVAVWAHHIDSYFVVAHFHYVVFGTVVFAMFAGFYFWWPKWTGRMLNERLGYVHFWMLFIGFHMTFLIHHWLGVEGMPRRYADYADQDQFTWQNQVSTIGAIILGADAAVLPQRLDHGAQGAEGHGERPLGLRCLAGVGDLVPAAAAQLHVDPAHPQRAPGVRPEPSGSDRGTGRTAAGGSATTADCPVLDKIEGSRSSRRAAVRRNARPRC